MLKCSLLEHKMFKNHLKFCSVLEKKNTRFTLHTNRVLAIPLVRALMNASSATDSISSVVTSNKTSVNMRRTLTICKIIKTLFYHPFNHNDENIRKRQMKKPHHFLHEFLFAFGRLFRLWGRRSTPTVRAFSITKSGLTFFLI